MDLLSDLLSTFAVLTTPQLLTCSVALISLMLDSCSQHSAISGCLFSFSTACSCWIIVKGVSGEGLGGTVILTIIVFICFSQRAWDQFIDNSNNLFACAFTSCFFFWFSHISEFHNSIKMMKPHYSSLVQWKCEQNHPVSLS